LLLSRADLKVGPYDCWARSAPTIAGARSAPTIAGARSAPTSSPVTPQRSQRPHQRGNAPIAALC